MFFHKHTDILGDFLGKVGNESSIYFAEFLMHWEVGKMAVKNSCFGPFSTNDFWCDEFLLCELLRDRDCFRLNQGKEQMAPSNWVLRGKFKYIFTNILAGCAETSRIITTLGGFSTPGLKGEGKELLLETSQ